LFAGGSLWCYGISMNTRENTSANYILSVIRLREKFDGEVVEREDTLLSRNIGFFSLGGFVFGLLATRHNQSIWPKLLLTVLSAEAIAFAACANNDAEILSRMMRNDADNVLDLATSDAVAAPSWARMHASLGSAQAYEDRMIKKDNSELD